MSAEEATRIVGDANLQSQLDAEVARATLAEQTNANAIATETTRATGIEAGLRTDVDANAASISGLDSDLTSEINRAIADPN